MRWRIANIGGGDGGAALPKKELAQLERLRGSKVVVACASDRQPKNLAAADVAEFSRVLHELPASGRLDLVLHTEGGLVSAARALALELRQAAPRLAVLVPHKARSAGTLLCLAADELVLGPLAEFSPIDPQIRGGRSSAAATPRRVSSEDVRCFRAMAEDWFGLRSEESRLKVLGLLTDRFLPTALGAFFRAEQYLKKAGRELLAHQLPTASAEERGRIVDRLIAGYGCHQDPICRQEIVALGLAARPASKEEARLLGAILAACQRFMNGPPPEGFSGRRRAIFFSLSGGIQFVAAGRRPAGSEERKGAASRGLAGRWLNLESSAQTP